METFLVVSTIVSHVVAIASIIVKFTPDQSDDAMLDKVIKVLKFISLAK